MTKGRFVIYVRRGPDDPGQPRNYDAHHKTREEAEREAARSEPPEGCEYVVRDEEPESGNQFGKKKKTTRPFGR